MSSTTAHKQVSLSRILLLSAAIQAAAVAIFITVEPLRKSRLSSGESREVRELDREAARRLREIEETRDRERENTALPREDAERLARKAEREKAESIAPQIAEMRRIRDQLAADEAAMMQALATRDPAEPGLYFYDQLHPLATQLVANARTQRETAPLDAALAVIDASDAFLFTLEAGKERTLLPEVFNRLRDAHRRIQEAQHFYIGQLDEAQRAYTANEERIRRENHAEYLVNLMRDRLAELLGEAATLDVATMNEAPPDYTTPPPAEDAMASDTELSVAQLHAQAVAIYDDIRTLFTGARAAAMAIDEHVAATTAFARVNAPRADTAFEPGKLPGEPGSVAELHQHAEALRQAGRDIGALWQDARNMGEAGQALVGRHAPGPPGSPGGGGPVGRAAAAAGAAQGRSGRYADMTSFQFHGGDGERGFGSTMGGGLDITHTSIRTGYREQGPGTPGSKGPPLLSEEKVIREALPGRRFSRNSPRSGWLYIDTWYVIGPWENRARIGFADPQPPETLVDLDATYPGKDGRTLAWRFHQSDNIRIKPPDETEQSVYYAYTEVYFDEESEMLVAVASDDAARIWLNGTLIWHDDGIGPWRLDEGFRKVVFRQGFNTILLRVENGPVTCTYSVLLCPPDVLL